MLAGASARNRVAPLRLPDPVAAGFLERALFPEKLFCPGHLKSGCGSGPYLLAG